MHDRSHECLQERVRRPGLLSVARTEWDIFSDCDTLRKCLIPFGAAKIPEIFQQLKGMVYLDDFRVIVETTADNSCGNSRFKSQLCTPYAKLCIS